MSYMIAISMGIATLYAFYLIVKNAGKTEQKLTKEEEINEAVQKALDVRDHLRRDTAYAERVRKRFTR